MTGSPLRRLLVALAIIALMGLPVIIAQQPTNNAPRAPRAPTRAATNPRKPVIKPTIPSADRHQPDKVFLEHADNLILEERPFGPQYQLLRGSVQFRKGDMFMYCDSAYFYEESNSLDAFSNIRMTQGDTLFVYADELSYDGATDMARLYSLPGKKVRMINRDVRLETDQFDYDLAANVGYYQFGGRLTDPTNTLTSVEGYYYPSTKDAFFYRDVVLEGPRQNDTVYMYTDSLRYNTASALATLLCQTLIVNKDGEIRSRFGTYQTRTEQADLFSRSMVITRRGNTLTGDTLFYDRHNGYGEAFGNMILTDSARQSTLTGDYGYYNELIDSAFVTGDALAMEYSQRDTLYTHGDTITITLDTSDSTHVTRSFHNVRFFRKDVQGLCDSMVFLQRDSTLYLYRHPIIWNGMRQIHGNQIQVHMNDSTVDLIRLPNFGMITEHIAEDCYDQLSGTDMTAWVNDTTINRLYVEGNVQLILFPMENDSSYNKFTFVESSFMDAYFKDNHIDRVTLWPETTGNVTPLYLARRSEYFLPNFQWFIELRPLAPDEVFDIPEKMRLLMAQPPSGSRRPGR